MGGNSAKAFQQVGQGLEQVGDTLDRRAMAEKQEMDASAAIEAYNGFSDELRSFLRDENSGLLLKQGKNAFGAQEQTKTFLDEKLAHYESTLDNKSQKQAFRAMTSSNRARALDAAANHAGEQRAKHMDQTMKNGLSGSIADAVNGYTDPRAVQDAIIKGTAFIRANRQGKSADVIQEDVERFQSDLHLSVIDRTIIDDPAAAKAYYEENKHQIDGKATTVVEKTLKTFGVRAEAQARADRIVGSGKSYGDQLKAARKISEPEVRDAVVQRVKVRHGEEEAIKNEQIEKAKTDTLRKFDESESFDAKQDIIDLVTDPVFKREMAADLASQVKAQTEKK
jgi:hypothetical protein